jgi:MFS superfamily sulfate permease-like transporter
MIGIIIAVIIVIAVIVAFPVVGIILGVIVAAVIFFARQSFKKQEIKDEEYKQFIQNTLSQHPEFENYKLFHGSDGVIFVLSEAGYYGLFRNSQFKSGNIYDIKTIKFVTEPFDHNIKKNTGLSGKIIYRLEFSDFQNPVVDLPFGAYADTADKAAKKSVFAEVKSTFDYIKKNSKNKNLSIGSYTASTASDDDESEEDEE